MIPTLEMIMAAGVKASVAVQWLKPVELTCAEFSINNRERIAGFLSQCAHESGGFTMLRENLNYRATTLAACWPNRFGIKNPDGSYAKDAKGGRVPNKFALALAGHPEAIANTVYGGRMGNGPIESGEGAKFIGRGLKQVTGKYNYSLCGTALGRDFVAHPEMLEDPEYAARSAGWFWASNKCSELADKGDITALTKRINGGLIGLADRQARYDRVIQAIKA